MAIGANILCSIKKTIFEVCNFKWICLLLFVFFFQKIQAQDPLSNLHTKKIKLQGEIQLIDSLTIIPNTVNLRNIGTKKMIPPSQYQIENNYLIWKDDIEKTDSIVEISYRTFPYQFAATQQHLDTLKIEKQANGDYIGFDYRPDEAESTLNLLGKENLDYSGSFSRGIAFGNSQDLVLNSSFNLQMAGTVGDGVEIAAAISDENVPLQPEGNTQNLQDFDQMSIQISKDNHELRAGDYELASADSYFMNYFKKLQGATYRNLTELDKGNLESKASVALTKGKFARNFLTIQEGNQGPYRLEGNEGERFLIILSSTERVYLDGRLLERGLEYDYVIDYNRGDLTFTNKILITKDSRIIVEFEYSDQNYLRSIYALNTDYQQDNLRLYFNLYSEQDSKNTSALNELSPSDKQLLARTGDALEGAMASGVRDVEGTADPIRYRLVDTLSSGISYDSVLVFTPNETAGEYTARFTEVGMGNGNYIRLPNAANGTVFQWVAPDDMGFLQGDHEPIIQLSAPTLQQMYTVGVDYQLSKHSSVQTEVALSNRDLNRFSKLDSNDDIGISIFSNYHFENFIGKKDSTWQFATDINYEFKQENFQALKPYRPQEFIRDWNLNNINTAFNDEHIGRAGFKISKQDLGALSYQFSSFLKGDLYTGLHHYGQFHVQQNGFTVLAKASFLDSKTELERSQFFRPNIDISKSFSKLNNWTIGVFGEREHNQRHHLQTDTLMGNSFAFDVVKVYLESPKDKPFQMGLNYRQRYDYSPTQSELVLTTFAEEFNFNGQWTKKRNSNLRWNITYRSLEIEEANLTKEVPLATILSNVTYGLTLFKGAVRSSTTYQLSAGQEPQLEYNYIEVNTGEGLYQWNDYNQDSIQQVNEFEIAVNQDLARYIRVSVLTDDFIRMNKVQFNQSLALNPVAIWRDKKGYRKALSRFATQSIFKISRRTREAPDVQDWNPFQLDLIDGALVAVNATIQNTLFFNRGHQLYDLQLGNSDNRNRSLLNTGFESRQISEQFFQARFNLIKKITAKLRLSQGARISDSERFDNRDFQINWKEIKPSVTFRVNNDYRLGGEYFWKDRTNELGSIGEQAKSQGFGLNMTYNKDVKTALTFDFSYEEVDFQGQANTPIAFALLEGLQGGKNYRWNLSLDRRIGKNIQLNIGYEGRKTGLIPIVHIGRMQVRAIF